MSELVERYLSCWNETDADARRSLLAGSVSPTVRYTDPLVDATGRDQLAAVIGAVQQQFPGLLFTRHGGVDEHHRQARFGWALGPADGEPLVLGFDVVRLDRDGRIETVLGFLDKVPAQAGPASR